MQELWKDEEQFQRGHFLVNNKYRFCAGQQCTPAVAKKFSLNDGVKRVSLPLGITHTTVLKTNNWSIFFFLPAASNLSEVIYLVKVG